MLGFLLVAALGADERFWDEVQGPLERVLPCRALGQAELRLPEQVAAMDEHRRDAAWSQVVVVGCAIGSIAAAAYAGTQPAHTAAAILVNATDRAIPTAATMLRERAAKVRQGGMQAILPDAVDRAFDRQPRDERYRRFLSRFAAQDAERYAKAIELSVDYDASSLIGRIRCPTLVLAGGHDRPLPPENARRVQSMIEGAIFEQVDEAAHFMPYQMPELFAARVMSFILDHVTQPVSVSNN